MNIYADVTDMGLQPFYTYTLEEIVEQYEHDGGRMPTSKVYVKYDEDEFLRIRKPTVTDTLNLAPNDPPVPTGREPVWMLSTTLPWPKPIDLPVDDEEKEYDFPYPHLGR